MGTKVICACNKIVLNLLQAGMPSVTVCPKCHKKHAVIFSNGRYVIKEIP